MPAKVDIELKGVPRKIRKICYSPEVGMFLAAAWLKRFNKYTPHETGTLQSNVNLEPFRVTYMQPYAHYQYEGKLYVDPVYLVGAFYNPITDRFWSRPGVTKIPDPSGRDLQYTNPLAQPHWDVPAKQAFSYVVANEVSQYLKKLGGK